MNMIKIPKRADISTWCSVLTTEGHKLCTWSGCTCVCHLRGSEGLHREQPKRPHSVPREVWEQMGANKQRSRVAWLALRHREGLDHDRGVVALRALGAGLGVGVPGGDEDLVDLEADADDR